MEKGTWVLINLYLLQVVMFEYIVITLKKSHIHLVKITANIENEM